jgi:hypothetical protein
MSLFSEAQQQQRMAEVKNDNETTESYNREEEYQRAQQAAVEAVMVGRETLEDKAKNFEMLKIWLTIQNTPWIKPIVCYEE